MIKNPIIIAGPCAAESEEQMAIAIREAKGRSVDFVRTNLWKPRTKPGFDGLGEKGLSLLTTVAKAGLNPGLEVILPKHITMAMDATLPHLQADGKLLVWIGARNQNHFIQREMAQIVAKNPQVILMIKNQPWSSEEHWEGILEHILEAGMPKERLWNCFRGFAPSGDNPLGLRNVPAFEMAMGIREKTGIPMLFDPSHTGGSVVNVFKMGTAAARYEFDGIIIEVHHDPPHALTDQKQQLTWQEFDELMDDMHVTREETHARSTR